MSLRKINYITSAISALSLLAVTVYILIKWKSIPDIIPSHYDGHGVIDGYSGKGHLFTLIIIGFAMCIGAFLLGHIEKIWTGDTSSASMIIGARIMVSAINVLISVNFAYLALMSAMCLPLGRAYLPIFILLMFVPEIVFVVFAAIQKQ